MEANKKISLSGGGDICLKLKIDAKEGRMKRFPSLVDLIDVDKIGRFLPRNGLN